MIRRRTPWLIGVCALAVAGVAALADPVAALLWAANVPDWFAPHAPLAADVAYGADPAQRLDVYAPSPGAAAAAPVVVFWHGGRWSSGDKAQYRFVALALSRAGAVAVLPNYRLYPRVRMAEAMRDVASAVAYVEAHAAQWGGDPRRVVLMGHSAGAQLAALAALDRHWLAAAGAGPVGGLVGLSGPYDFLPLTDADLIDYFGPASAYPESQPIRYVDGAAPPTFLVHGLADQSVRLHNTVNLARALQAAGVPVEAHLVPAEDHGAVLRRFARPWRGRDPVVDALGHFLATVRGAPRSVAGGAAARTVAGG